jgi:pimeloyl-ACP methyl ester carboxylesterase
MVTFRSIGVPNDANHHGEPYGLHSGIIPNMAEGLYLDMRGSGSNLVLLHGTPSSLDDFGPLVDAFASRRRVVMPHLPGYGRTPRAHSPLSMEWVIAAIEDRLLAEGVTQADFIAFSGGAYKAVALALRRRIAIRRMVLLAPMVGLDASAAQSFREVAQATRAGVFDPRASWLDRMTSPGFADRNPAGAARVLRWLDAAPLSVICDELLAAADAPDLRPRLAELECEVLVCAGEMDNAVSAASSEQVASLAKQGQFHLFKGAGHAFLVECPREVINVVASFLDVPPREGHINGGGS